LIGKVFIGRKNNLGIEHAIAAQQSAEPIEPVVDPLTFFIGDW